MSGRPAIRKKLWRHEDNEMVTPRRASHYPDMKIRILWAFLECLCFSGLTGGWDLLFRTFSDQHLLFFGGQRYDNVSDAIQNNCSRASAIPDAAQVAENSLASGQGNMSDLCENNISTIGNNVLASRLILAVTCLVYMLVTVPLGALYDRYGTLKTRFVAM